MNEFNAAIDRTIGEFLIHFVEQKYPNDKRVWSMLSHCQFITLDMVRERPDRPWHYDKLGARLDLNVSLTAFETHPEGPWNFFQLSMHDDITWDIVSRHPDKPWDFNALSYHRAIDFETVVLRNPDRPWSYDGLSCHVSANVVMKYPDLPWRYDLLSRHQVFPIEFLQAHLDKEWDWQRLSENIDYETVIRPTHDTLPWHWWSVSQNPSVTFNMVQRDHDMPWDYGALSSNCNITWANVVSTDFKGGWDFGCLSRIADWTFVSSHPTEFDWNWYMLSTRVPVDVILAARKCYKWNWRCVSQNPSLRMMHVTENMNIEWHAYWLTEHDFAVDRAEMYLNMARRHLAAMRIQQYWRKAVQRPTTALARRVQLYRIHLH